LSKLVWLGVRVITRILKSNPHSVSVSHHYGARPRTAAVTAGTAFKHFFSGHLETWTGGNHGSFEAVTPLPSWPLEEKVKLIIYLLMAFLQNEPKLIVHLLIKNLRAADESDQA
jgi:hypothetical protein